LRANSTDLACYSIASILYNTERWATDIVQASVSRHATCGVTHSTEAEAYSLQHTDEWIALAQCVLQLVREFHVHVMQYRSQRMTPADTLQLDTNLHSSRLSHISSKRRRVFDLCGTISSYHWSFGRRLHCSTRMNNKSNNDSTFTRLLAGSELIVSV
jgi:hypothetical protein